MVSTSDCGECKYLLVGCYNAACDRFQMPVTAGSSHWIGSTWDPTLDSSRLTWTLILQQVISALGASPQPAGVNKSRWATASRVPSHLLGLRVRLVQSVDSKQGWDVDGGAALHAVSR